MNFIKGAIIKKNNKFYFNEGNFQVKIIDEMYPKISQYENKEIIFGVRPEDIYDKLFVSEASSENTVRATCEIIEPMGSEVYLYLTPARVQWSLRSAAITNRR